MKSRLFASLTALTIATATLIPTAAKAGGAPPVGAGSRSAAPTCAVVFVVGKQTCYAPASVAVAERSAPWAIRPDSAMALTFGIPLSQVFTVQQQSSPRHLPSEIDYLYGPLRHDYGRQGARPIAIRIAEYNTRANEAQYKPAWTHQICGVKVEISPAANPTRPHPKHGPWYLVANMKHGNRSIGITANTGQLMLQTLACRMLQNS